nr:MAG TPA: hypothetical protein [Inoviridae sp.]
MEDYIIVLGVGKPYDIASEDGSHITGCSMSYIADGRLYHSIRSW